VFAPGDGDGIEPVCGEGYIVDVGFFKRESENVRGSTLTVILNRHGCGGGALSNAKPDHGEPRDCC